MECLYLLLIVFHFTAGCSLSGEQSIKEIRRHTGGSVLLPCSCTDLQTKPQRITWKINRNEREWTEILTSVQYKGRLKQFNEDSPANLSLLISDLREEDEGEYSCQIEEESREFWLYVKGCDLVKTAGIEEVKFSGESVVLLCSCTDLQTKPNTVKWEFSSETYDFEEIYSTQTGRRKDKVRLTNRNSGNLSLLISDLSEEDQGVYRCSVQHDFKNIRLHVKVRETPSHLWTTDPTTTPSEDPLTTAMNENERIMLCVAR
ncbi:protein sidekick homolog [Pygocentrus nattereri]|uniref:protein sidekick homolog n=1 Tax=Pygocentrus nattereri TaxID=42514 RepID=UPI0018914398|nr:protein sidekick homolog [Pygocentrus nattereri]